MALLVSYVLKAGRDLTLKDVEKAMKTLPHGEETVQTVAEQLRREGFLIGEKRGIQLALLEALRKRFGAIPPALAGKIASIQSPETLKELFALALDAPSLKEFAGETDRVHGWFSKSGTGTPSGFIFSTSLPPKAALPFGARSNRNPAPLARKLVSALKRCSRST